MKNTAEGIENHQGKNKMDEAYSKWTNSRTFSAPTPHNFLTYLQFQSSNPLNNLPQIPLTLQKRLHIWPLLHRIHKLHQPRIFLQSFPSILRQLFIMAYLVQHYIRIREPIPNDKRTPLSEITTLQVLRYSFEIICTCGAAVLGICCFLLWIEKSDYEECAP